MRKGYGYRGKRSRVIQSYPPQSMHSLIGLKRVRVARAAQYQNTLGIRKAIGKKGYKKGSYKDHNKFREQYAREMATFKSVMKHPFS
jgi:hypothetical protein